MFFSLTILYLSYIDAIHLPLHLPRCGTNKSLSCLIPSLPFRETENTVEKREAKTFGVKGSNAVDMPGDTGGGRVTVPRKGDPKSELDLAPRSNTQRGRLSTFQSLLGHGKPVRDETCEKEGGDYSQGAGNSGLST